MKKLLNKKGFTLMEMLIVVAIIVILVAISVPTFTANLGEAKAATDAANLRAAKSAAAMYALEHSDVKVYYDADAGNIVTGTDNLAYGQCSQHEDGYVVIEIDDKGTVTSVEWSKNPGACAE